MPKNSRHSTNNFSLSRNRGSVLADYVIGEDGEKIPIDPDFRCILRCIRVLDDPELDDEKKLFLLMRWFFKSRYVPDALDLFVGFVSNADCSDDEPPVMDFEQDADAIYASFVEQYGIDLLDVDTMHWRKFSVLLGGINEKTPLGRRIAIRDMDTTNLKGKDKIKADRAKRRVALKERMSKAERDLQSRLDEVLASGGDPTEVLNAMRAFYGGESNGI